MKKLILILFLCSFPAALFSQKTMLIEKLGTSRKYFYHVGDYVKLRVSKQDTLLKGKLWFIKDSLISVEELRPFDVHLGDIGSVYKQFSFPKRFGAYLGAFGVGIFAIMATNHLLNNEQVFTTDMYIISGAFIGGSLISFSLSQKRCKIGNRWKIKVLDYPLN